MSGTMMSPPRCSSGSSRIHQPPEPRAALLVIGPERAKLAPQVTDAHAQDHSTAREPVERRVLLGNVEGAVVRQDDHVRQEAQSLGEAGDEGQRRRRLVPGRAHEGHGPSRHNDMVGAGYPRVAQLVRLLRHGDQRRGIAALLPVGLVGHLLDEGQGGAELHRRTPAQMRVAVTSTVTGGAGLPPRAAGGSGPGAGRGPPRASSRPAAGNRCAPARDTGSR